MADFNGDGIPDLAVNDNTLVIYLGKADGTYTEAPIPSIQGPAAGPMAVDDFNGDGIPDLAVAMYSSAGIAILLGNGDGTFATPVQASLPNLVVNTTQLLAADFNGDGIPDLAMPDNSGQTVDILLGNGDGTFSAAVSSPLSLYPSCIAAGHMSASEFRSYSVAVPGDGNPVSVEAAKSLIFKGVFGRHEETRTPDLYRVKVAL